MVLFSSLFYFFHEKECAREYAYTWMRQGMVNPQQIQVMSQPFSHSPPTSQDQALTHTQCVASQPKPRLATCLPALQTLLPVPPRLGQITLFKKIQTPQPKASKDIILVLFCFMLFSRGSVHSPDRGVGVGKKATPIKRHGYAAIPSPFLHLADIWGEHTHTHSKVFFQSLG